MNYSKLNTLVLGLEKPSFDFTEVEVEITGEMFTDYAEAFIAQARSRNPQRFSSLHLDVQTLEAYQWYLVTQRVRQVRGLPFDGMGKLKTLYISVWVGHNLELIGEVLDVKQMVKLVPELPTEKMSKMTFQEASIISQELGLLSEDLVIERNAFPGDITGDIDLMSTALIEGIVRARSEVNIAKTYCTAYLGFKLKQEAAQKAIYRPKYEETEFIRASLFGTRCLY